MASLPPKPQDSPSRENLDSSFPPDDRPRRPSRSTGPSHRAPFHGGRYASPPSGGRVYLPRSPPRRPPIADSYVAPPYDGRREAEPRRRGEFIERERASWDRPRDRDPAPRFREARSDYDRNRRGYERDPHYERDRQYERPRDSYAPPRRGPSPRRALADMSHRRSRSPRRRPSPGRPYRPRSRSPLPSRSPPPHKRMRLGNHSIDAGPRRDQGYHSPSGFARRSREKSRSPPRQPRSRSPQGKNEITPQNMEVVKAEELAPIHPTEPHEGLTTPASAQSGPSRPPSPTPPPKPKPTIKSEPTPEAAAPSPPREPMAHRHPEAKKEAQAEVKQVTEDRKPRERSPSPPRQPRYRGPPPPPPHPDKPTRSPPRGPRNHPGNIHPRGNVTPTGPASSYPPGPRGQRRPYPASAPLPAPPIPQETVPSVVMEDQPTPAPEAEVKFPMPQIPMKKLPPSLTPELDAELARLQAHRAHLASEYAQLEKGARRALHELDTATIDLRAAELRRRVADIQYEKARNGVLGIDYVPTDASIV
ncbi:hypothetical protein D9615_001659 [Tricholomella constricta]|uniref:Uncharacterized protein n=1 Tax=Tricholomella constricta TaxID=117010 RepID=A0A8H5MAN5_9AGAR|nr:hypothetical protein D9615_001659 [Tricholomella constricta]